MKNKMIWLLCSIFVLSILLAACNEGPERSGQGGGSGDATTVEIIIGEDDYGARMLNYDYAFNRLNEELKAEGKNVEVVAKILPSVGDDELVLQFTAGTYRDISMNSSLDLGWELDAGLIQSIDWLMDSEVFADLPENLWNIMRYDGHIYSAIQDMDAMPLYVNRNVLKKLGWSETDIDALPDRVLKGDFTLHDVIDLAGEAVQKNLVNFGLACDGMHNVCIQAINNQIMGFEAYDIDQNKVIVDEKGIKDTYAFWKKGLENGAITRDMAALEDVGFEMFYKEEIMFFLGGINVYRYVKEASGLDDANYEQWFYDNVQFTLVPPGEKGGTPGSLANPRVYFVSSQTEEEKLPYVQRIIELAMAPERQVEHTIMTGKLPVTRDAQEDPRFKEYRFLHDVAYMLDYTTVRPPHLSYPDYSNINIKSIELLMVRDGSVDEAYDMFMNNFEPLHSDADVIYR